MLIENQTFFNIPLKNSKVQIKNVNLNNIYFKNSNFIYDSSTGFDEGTQIVSIEDFYVTDIVLIDSNLILINNARLFYGKNWSFISINSALNRGVD